MGENPLSMEFFEAKYRNAADPWDFADSPYEQTRYDEIMRRLGKRRFQRAFEPGCSVGILTARLAAVCDEVIAIDISPTAVERARARCARWRGATVEAGSLPEAIPDGQFDLVVFSEIGYYLSAEALASVAAALTSRLTSDGTFLAAHWLGVSKDHALSGDEVHEVLGATRGLIRAVSQRYDGFRIEVWRRA